MTSGIGYTLLFCFLLSFSRAQNDGCSSQPKLPTGSGPVASPDTPSNFYTLPAITNAASNAPTPANYTLAYSNLHASSNAEGYQGYSTLTTYNTTECARLCNANDRCIAFNILFERNPSVELNAEKCLDAPSTTLIKCVLWSEELSHTNAVNTGETRYDFQVLIAGSNAYNKRKPPVVPGYLEPINLGHRAISAPTCSNGVRTGISQIFTYTNDPYNITRAAEWCDTRAQGCKFFNCYITTYAAGPQIGRVFGQICDFYSLPWGKEYATKATTYFDGPALAISESFAVTSSDAPGACAAPAPA